MYDWPTDRQTLFTCACVGESTWVGGSGREYVHMKKPLWRFVGTKGYNKQPESPIVTDESWQRKSTDEDLTKPKNYPFRIAVILLLCDWLGLPAFSFLTFGILASFPVVNNCMCSQKRQVRCRIKHAEKLNWRSYIINFYAVKNSCNHCLVKNK